MQSLDSAFNSVITWIVVAFLGLFSVAGFLLRNRARLAAQALQRAADALEREFHDLSGRASHDVAPRARQLVEEKEALPYLANQWRDLEAGLVKRDALLFKSADAEVYFTERELEHSVRLGIPALQVRVPYSFVHELPAFMVGLGMLGTFVGIAIGLGQLAGEAATGDKIVDEIGGVITGLAAAFWTSIFGLAVATVNTWRNHKHDTTLELSLAHFRLQIDRTIPTASGELVLEKQLRSAEHQGQLLAGLKDLAQQRGHALTELKDQQAEANSYLHEMANDLAEQIGTRTADMLVEQLEPLLRSVEDAVRSQVSDATKPVLEMFESLTKGMHDGLSSAIDQIGSQAGVLAQRFEAAGEGLGQQVDVAVSKLHSGIEGASERLSTSLEGTMGRVADGMGSIGDKMLAHVESVGDSFGGVLESLESGVAKASDSLSNAVERSMKQASQGVARLGLQMTANVRQTATQMEQVVTGVGERMNQTLEQVAEGLSRTGVEMVKSVEGAGAELSRALQETIKTIRVELDELLGSTRDQIRRVATDLMAVLRATNKVTDDLDKLTTRQFELLSKQKESAEEVNAALAGLGSSIRLISQHGQSLQKTIAALEATMTRIEASRAALESASDTIERGFQTSSQALEQATGAMNATVVDLRLFRDRMTVWMSETGGQLERFSAAMTEAVSSTLREFDASLSNAVRGLSSSAAAIEHVADSLASSASRADTAS